MSEEVKFDKTIDDQIFDKTIEKLLESNVFSEKLVAQIKKVDLTNKTSVKAALSVFENEEE